MKQIRKTEVETLAKEKLVEASVKKCSAKAIVSIVSALAVCTAGVFAVSGNILKKEKAATESTTLTTETISEQNIVTSDEDKVTTDSSVTFDMDTYKAVTTISGQLNWWKAGVEEYALADLEDTKTEHKKKAEKQTTTTTTPTSETKEATTTTAKKEKTTTTTTAKTTTAAETKPAEPTVSYELTTWGDGGCYMYTTKKVYAYTAPDTNSSDLGYFPKNSTVWAVGDTDNGYYVLDINGTQGFVDKNALTFDDPYQQYVTENNNNNNNVNSSNNNNNSSQQENAPTVYTTDTISYTDEEFEMLTYVLAGEVGGCSEESVIAVTNVIINRVKSSSFPNSIEGVLTQKSQFSALRNYYSHYRNPDDTIISGAKKALEGEDNSGGALFYYAPRYCSASTARYFEQKEFCLELDNQRYFK